MKAPRLTKTQARAVRSLVEDSGGYSEREARILVLEGFGEEVDRLLRLDRDERGRDEVRR